MFEGTKEITDRIEKIFILCPMPFISMIMLKRDDVCDCLIWVTFLVGVAILLFMVKGINFKSVGNRTSKINKVE